MVAAVFIIIPTLGTSYSHIGKYCFPCWEYYIHESSRPRISKYSRKNLVNSRFFRTFASQYLISMRMEKRKGKSGKSLWCLILVLLGIAVKGNAQRNDSVVVAPDSSNFVTASLVIISPTNDVYSSLGHCAIRMECPTHRLDFCFSSETETGSFNDFINFLIGKTSTAMFAVESDAFLKRYKAEKRGIWQFQLNLTHHEKQDLWRKLDEEVMKGAHRSFTLKNNCVSLSLMLIQSALMKEELDFGELPEIFNHDNGDLMRKYLENTPWAEFFLFTIGGSEAEKTYDPDIRFTPKTLGEVIMQTQIVSLEDGARRPAVVGGRKELSKQETTVSKTSVTPMMVFGTLFLLVLIITIAEWWLGWKTLAKATDIILFTLQCVLGILLPIIVIMLGLVDVHWNWYLIPLNPLPLIIYVCFRKREWFGKVYLLYALVLVAFICLTPFISQLDWEHQLITAMFAIRCISNYGIYYKKNN